MRRPPGANSEALLPELEDGMVGSPECPLPAEMLALCSGSVQPRVDALQHHLALELGEH